MKARMVYAAMLALALVGAGAGLSQLPQAAPVTTQAAATQTLPDFAAIVEANKGAVVNITSSTAAKEQAEPQVPEEFRNGPFGEFFRRFQIPQPNIPRQGMGSGFIVEPDGVILTNAHVVEGADEVRVRLTDRREFKGKVLGADKATDIAVVRIEAKGLPAVRLGDPRSIKVGEWVLAIGAPFGF